MELEKESCYRASKGAPDRWVCLSVSQCVCLSACLSVSVSVRQLKRTVAANLHGGFVARRHCLIKPNELELSAWRNLSESDTKDETRKINTKEEEDMAGDENNTKLSAMHIGGSLRFL